MAKKVMQFRYYADNDSRNQPAGTASRYTKGTIFEGYTPIVKIGIQTIPGTKFYLNDSVYPILVGPTGIYELDLEGFSEVNKLLIDPKSMYVIGSNPGAYLIIDVVYDN